MDQLKDREIRMLGSTARANNFFVIVVSVMFVNVITAAMVSAGYQSISLALIIIFANLFMFLAASGAMDDLKAFSMDMDDEQKKTNVGQSYGARPYDAFKRIGQVFNVLLVVAQLAEMYAG